MQTAQWPTPAATPTDSSAHGWPLTLPPEPLRFYKRMMLARLRQRAATAAVEGAPSNDDPLVLEVLEGALTSLRVCAVDGGKEGAAPAAAASASPPQPSLLSLPHNQLLLLLWHSVSDAARADLMAATAASLCAAVDAATTRAAAVAPTDSAAGAAPLSPTQWVATLRLLQWLQYMLKCFERVPAHLAPQLHAQLSAFDEPLGSTKPVAAAAAVAAAAEPPSGPAADAALQQTLAAALVAFEPAAGRLRFGEPAGAADEGSTHGGGAAATPPTASSAVHVFAPTDLYELLPRGESGASAAALGALAARRALCSTSRLHAALCSLLDIHLLPPPQPPLLRPWSPAETRSHRTPPAAAVRSFGGRSGPRHTT
jgi:hypothetical protein